MSFREGKDAAAAGSSSSRQQQRIPLQPRVCRVLPKDTLSALERNGVLWTSSLFSWTIIELCHSLTAMLVPVQRNKPKNVSFLCFLYIQVSTVGIIYCHLFALVYVTHNIILLQSTFLSPSVSLPYIASSLYFYFSHTHTHHHCHHIIFYFSIPLWGGGMDHDILYTNKQTNSGFQSHRTGSILPHLVPHILLHSQGMSM